MKAVVTPCIRKAGISRVARVVRGELLAEMGVRIDEARRDDHPARVDHPRRAIVEPAARPRGCGRRETATSPTNGASDPV